MMYSAIWYFIPLANRYSSIMQPPSSALGISVTVAPARTTPQWGERHAHAAADPAGSRLVDRTRIVRSLDTAGSVVSRPLPAPGQGLEDPGPDRVRRLFLPVVLPAVALGQHAGPASDRRPAGPQPVRRCRHRRAGL